VEYCAPEVLRGEPFSEKCGESVNMLPKSHCERFDTAARCALPALQQMSLSPMLAADIWSYGVVLWELFNRTRPYADAVRAGGFSFRNGQHCSTVAVVPLPRLIRH
jgi:hypothetical protein